MSERTDLTRWNRAGLSRFRYIDGNAATHLEVLRQALHEYFPNWEEVQSEPISEEVIQQSSGRERESLLRKRQEQLLQRYQAESRDMGWLIARSLARACHILTEHADAYANEGYIDTATQWDHVRRMVEMLDYHPTPPASATTYLALMAKENKAGAVTDGFQVKYAPEDGGSPVKFETLDDIEIDSALNQLHPKDWNKSQTAISEDVIWVKENGDSIEELEISSGDVGILLHTELETGKVIFIADINHTAGTMVFASLGFSGAESWPEHQVELLTGAKDVRAVKISGEGVVEFDQATGLSAGDVISWYSFGWKFNEVVETDGTLIRLANPGIFPAIGDPIYRLNRIDKTNVDPYPPDTIIFPLEYENIVVRDGGSLRAIETDDYELESNVEDEEEYKQIKIDSISEIYIRYESDNAISQQVMAVNPSDFVVDGAPKGLRSGDWLVGASDKEYFALQIESIEERENDFVICFASFAAHASMSSTMISDSLGSILRKIQVAMDEDELRDRALSFFIDGDADDLPVTAIQGVGDFYAGKFTAGTTIRDLLEISATSVAGISDIRLREFKTKAEMILNFEITKEFKALSDSTVYELLEGLSADAMIVTPGEVETSSIQRIYGPLRYTLRPEGFDRNEDWLEAGNNIELETMPETLAKGRAVLLEYAGNTLVSEVEELGGGTTIKLTDKIEVEIFTKADTKVYANVIRAGHGERKPEKILGSGDATQSNQSFILSVKDVSFVPDATMASSVRADIDVVVDGQVWEQVSTLNDSAPTDIHYAVRMTEEAFLKIIFGDGTLARRLPTGKNNLRVSYRLGTGLAGNLDAGSLEKPVKPHAYVKSVIHAMDSSGGNDMEDAASLRENAPPTVLTLERAVSISDFARLAASHSSIWQANAFVRLDASGRDEHIEVVVVPADGGELGGLDKILKDYLLAHALPGVQISVTLFDTLRPRVEVTIHVDSDQYDSEIMEADVRSALLDTFSLRRRKLGQNLYLSEIYAVVENITGVERSICNIRENGGAEQRVIKAGNQRRVVYMESNDLTMQPPEEYEP